MNYAKKSNTLTMIKEMFKRHWGGRGRQSFPLRAKFMVHTVCWHSPDGHLHFTHDEKTEVEFLQNEKSSRNKNFF